MLGGEPPAPVPPTSSSLTEMTSRSPCCGRQPSLARLAAATASAAVCDFMSRAPRPHTQPSSSSPDQGPWRQPSRVRDDGVHVREEAERRPGSVAAKAGNEVGPGRVVAQQRGLEAGVVQEGLQELLRRALVAGRVDGVEAEEALEDLGGLLLERVRHRQRSYARPS